MNLPRCAWILIGALLLLLHQTIGAEATIRLATDLAVWTLTTPAALVTIAVFAAHHLITRHDPRPAHAP